MGSAAPIAGTMDRGRADARAARASGACARELLVAAIPADSIDDWQTLVDRASEPNAFAEPWFVAPSLAHLRGGDVRLIEVRDSARLIGVIMLGVEQHYGRIPVAHVQNWRHHHHFLAAPLVAGGEEEAFWGALLRHLDAASWAPNFLHVQGLVEDGPILRGLEAATAALRRPAAIVHREVRAALASDLSPQAYYDAVIRKKKRKELARLRNRLAEEGALTRRTFGADDDLTAWCDHFLALERGGWKGREGSALACSSGTETFFRDAVAGAHAAGRLQFLSLELDGRPIAMLVNFLTPPGSFSFKTAFDENYARFSPGVLIQRDNLDILDRADIDWMDSCAAQEHPMIDSLWAERRTIVRVTVPLKGVRRRAVHAAARTIERLSAARRRRTTPSGDEA